MPIAKSPPKPPFRSPAFCCDCVLRTFRNPLLQVVFLSAVLVLLATAVILVICGALYASNSLAFYAVGVILVTLALLLAAALLWLKRRRFCKQKPACGHQMRNPTVSSIKVTDYYSQMPPGRKTDFPMGPHLVMTLPRPSRARTRKCSVGSDGGSLGSITPGPTRKYHGYRNKNIPPLASEETLSPSLGCSSYGSINSVV